MRYWKRFLYLPNINLVCCQLQHTMFFPKFVLVGVFFSFLLILKETNTFLWRQQHAEMEQQHIAGVQVDYEPHVC